jgi:predicted Rossmann fold nucleotide-binding protein DprA/Smf involved in DNA uptake
LLTDGAQPLLDPDDVLVALGLTPGSRRGWGAPPPRATPKPDGARILEACTGEAATVDQLISRTRLPPEAVTDALRALEAPTPLGKPFGGVGLVDEPVSLGGLVRGRLATAYPGFV